MKIKLQRPFAELCHLRRKEMTPEQLEDEQEQWLRDQVGQMEPYHHAHYMRLLLRLDALRAPIDMVLFCPKCGMQHIDKDNHDENRIKAAELGIDREGDRAYSDWLDEHDWDNPPHRSHLCADPSCGHIWRPADVPTNGVASVKTKGSADSPLARPMARVPPPPGTVEPTVEPVQYKRFNMPLPDRS